MSSNSSSTPTRLPLAPNRAVVANRISMLLSAQSTVLKTMNLSKPTHAPGARTAQPSVPAAADDGDDFMRGSRPNEGVGYVADKKPVAAAGNARAERVLRRGMSGGRERGGGGGGGGGRRVAVESESEDDVGRSAVGRRKRKRRAGEEQEEPAQDATTVDGAGDGSKEEEARSPEGDGAEIKKRMKRKKKSKGKKKKHLPEPVEAST